FLAGMAAVLYGINAPFSQLLLNKVSPFLMASLLYFGAGFGMGIIWLLKSKKQTNHLEAKEWPYIVGMILLDVLAPIMLMLGLKLTTAANASLLNNFEIVATSLFALMFFHEKIDKRMWLAIVFILLASFFLSIEDPESLSFSKGSLFVILAAFFWGLENNCTRVLSTKDPLEIVIMKGIASGTGSLIVALIIGIDDVVWSYIVFALLLGFVAYGLSIYLYVRAQRDLGASKTSAFYAFAPFVGTGISLIIFKSQPTWLFLGALIFMLIGAYLVAKDYLSKQIEQGESI
ncbi:MAG: DMT family transporter, partial [Bacilli bacterium]